MMGLVYADIVLYCWADIILQQSGYINENEIKKVQTKALVDSGAYMLAINEVIKNMLDLKVIKQQRMELAYGTLEDVDIVGPVSLWFENRQTSCNAVVLPGDNEVLLGVIPMEDLDVIIDPKSQSLIVNPDSPEMARKKLK